MCNKFCINHRHLTFITHTLNTTSVRRKLSHPVWCIARPIYGQGEERENIRALTVRMGLLPDTQNCGMHLRREYREHYPRHRLQRKPLFSDPVMHHGTYVTHVLWCMPGSLTLCGGGNVPGIPGAWLVRGRWDVIVHEPTSLATDRTAPTRPHV